MEVKMRQWRIITFIFLTLLFFGTFITDLNAAILFQDDFNYTGSPTAHGWNAIGSRIAVVSGGVTNNAAEVTYSSSGTSYYAFSKNIQSFNKSAIYVRFYFKADTPSGGCKFLKLFGVSGGSGIYANTTFAINYYSGTLQEISYGPGDSTANDTQATIGYGGSHTDSAVSVPTHLGSITVANRGWHCFEIYMKYNDDNQRNGEYKVWYDGALQVHATNVKNRHNSDPKVFKSIDLANYCHSNWSQTWHLWFDNVVISDSYIGPIGAIGTGTGQSTDTTDTTDTINPPEAPKGLTIIQ
jgi:hypothetical protein